MYDLFTDQRLAKIRQQELIALGQQSARNRRVDRAKAARRLRFVPALARLLVMLGH